MGDETKAARLWIVCEFCYVCLSFFLSYLLGLGTYGSCRAWTWLGGILIYHDIVYVLQGFFQFGSLRKSCTTLVDSDLTLNSRRFYP